MPMIEPNERHQAFLFDLKAALYRRQASLPFDEMLAVASQFVGMLIALQDQRRISPEAAMAIVEAGIEAGNAAFIEASDLMAPKGLG